MQLKIEKTAYFDVEKISILKTYVSRVIKNENDNNNGKIEMNLSYLNNNGEECFKTINLDYELELNDFEIIDVKILSTKVYVIESNGVNIDYEIEIEYDKLVEPIIEIVNDEIIEEPIIEVIDDKIFVEDDSLPLPEEVNDEIEKIKEDISKDYENKLIDSLNRKEENQQIKIISTKDDRNELEFIKCFKFEERGYHLIKTLYCPNDDVLNDISKKYNIDFNILLRGYDKVNKKVTFRLNE